MVVDQFDEMLEQCVKHPLSCATSRSTPTCSASLSGCDRCASRSKHLCRAQTAGPGVVDPAGEIAEFCNSMQPGIIPGS